EEAYKIVQENAMKVWKDRNLWFKDLVMQDSRITSVLSKEEIEKIFDVGYYLRYVDEIFKRVFGN
ncbi:MAG: adenylosuccinate lyase, partial [Thermodesulfobacteria bacterium]|nr:adenylosuccinate lyase [Thermodesulfobacteriota bacterium]